MEANIKYNGRIVNFKFDEDLSNEDILDEIKQYLIAHNIIIDKLITCSLAESPSDEYIYFVGHPSKHVDTVIYYELLNGIRPNTYQLYRRDEDWMTDEVYWKKNLKYLWDYKVVEN